MLVPADYTASLNADGLKGARIGVPSDPAIPPTMSTTAQPPPPASDAQHHRACSKSRRDDRPRQHPDDRLDGRTGPDMAVLNPIPRARRGTSRPPLPTVFVYELKNATRSLFARLGDGNRDELHVRRRRLQQGASRTRVALRPGHLPRRRSDPRRSRGARIQLGAGDGYPHVAHARPRRLYGRRTGWTRCCSPARWARRSPPSPAIRASRCRRGSPRVGNAETPDYPIGATFTGRAWSEPTLLRLAYAYEQASRARRPPPGYPAL